MSEGNVETVERMWKTLMSGDPSILPLSFLDPEVTYEDEILPDHVGETYHGHEGIQRAWTQALEPVMGGVFENDLMWARDAGDAVVSGHHIRSQGAASGVEIEWDYAYVWKLRKGKIFYCKAFRDPSEALEAAGLQEQAVSEENVEVVERLIAALNAGDVDRYLALCTPDVEYVGPAMELEGVERGEGLRAYLSTLAELANSFRVLRIEVEQLQALEGDRVLSLTRLTFEPHDGAPGDQPTAGLYYFAGAKVRRIEVFLDRAEALEAAGLSE